MADTETRSKWWKRTKVWTVTAAVGTAMGALFTAASAFFTWQAAEVARSAAQDARLALSREDAPGLFLSCAAESIPTHSMGLGFLNLAPDDDVDVYRVFGISPYISVDLSKGSWFRCTVTNLSRLAAAQIVMGFRIYFVEASTWPPHKYAYTFQEVPDVERVAAFPSKNINLLPTASYTFAFSNTSRVGAYIQPLEIAQVTVPGAGAACVPVYLDYWTALRNFLPAVIGHGTQSNYAKIAATQPAAPVPQASSSCLDPSDILSAGHQGRTGGPRSSSPAPNPAP